MIGENDHAYYHFVLEYALGLFKKRPTTEQLQESKILLFDKRYDFKKQWLKILFPSLTDNNFIRFEIGNEIYCKKLIPCGRFMGLPIQMRSCETVCIEANEQIRRNLSLSKTKPKTMLLIKRTHSRGIDCWHEIHQICLDYCSKHGLKLDVFDDSVDLGTVETQLRRFNTAKIIIGGHGAAYINLLACSHLTTLIEFRGDRPEFKFSKQDPPMYKKLCRYLGMKYHDIHVENNLVSIPEVKNCLDNIDNENITQT